MQHNDTSTTNLSDRFERKLSWRHIMENDTLSQQMISHNHLFGDEPVDVLSHASLQIHKFYRTNDLGNSDGVCIKEFL